MESSRRSSFVATLAAVVIASFGRSVHAAASHAPETVKLVYRAPAQCEDESSFAREVLRRTSRVRFGDVTSGRTFEVSISPAGAASERLVGVLQTEDADGTHGASRFEADSCSEVSDALALLVSLAVDPRALEAPLPPPPAPTLPVRDALPARDATPSRRFVASLSAGAFVAEGLAPVLIDGASAFIDVADTKGSIWSPAVRLGVLAGATGVASAPSSRADFTWVSGRLEACPSRLTVGPVSLRACAVSELGALRGSGNEVAVRESSMAPFWTVGALGRGRFVAVGRFFMEADLGVVAPITRPYFTFETPYALVFQPSSVVAEGAISAGVSFP